MAGAKDYDQGLICCPSDAGSRMLSESINGTMSREDRSEIPDKEYLGVSVVDPRWTYERLQDT